MIVIDSSVWIELFNDSDAREVEELVRLLRSEEVVAITGLILTEVLRGCSSEQEARRVARELVALPLLELSAPEDHMEAARLFRQARSAGVTVRKTTDLLIAATCIKFEASLLHRDRDFDHLAKVTELKVWGPGAAN